MKKSEIFNTFEKIMVEKGFIYNAEKSSKQILEETGRADSLTFKQIAEDLYDLKPEAPKDMQYKNNIMELAHPDPIVIAPSYDKVNGLVETEQERQDITRRFLSRIPSGQLFNQKYASQQLILSIVKAGNDLENHNEEQLRILADTCLLQLSEKSITKNAIAPLVGIVAIGALLGAIYLKEHLPNSSEGFKMDTQKLLSEINDLLNSNSNYGIGYQYSPEFLETMNDLKSRVEQFADVEAQAEAVLDELEKPGNAKELQQAANHPDTQKTVQAYNQLQAATNTLFPYIDKIVQNFDSDFYKNRQIENKGILTEWMDEVPGLHGGSGLIADNMDDVKMALQTYKKDIQDILKTLDAAKSTENNFKNDATSVATKEPSIETPANKAEEKAPWDFAGLESGLSQYGLK